MGRGFSVGEAEIFPNQSDPWSASGLVLSETKEPFMPRVSSSRVSKLYSRSRGRDEYPLMAKFGKALRNFVQYR